MEKNSSILLLLRALAAIRQEMITVAQKLRDHRFVVIAESKLDVRDYPVGGLQLHAYLDVELRDTRAISYWIEARWEAAYWVVEASVDELRDSNRQCIQAFAPRSMLNDEELPQILLEAASHVLKSAGDLVARSHW
jgi:hypothetical protein